MRFLVAVDGSDQSRDALGFALELTNNAGHEVTVVHAVEPRVYSEGETGPKGFADARDRLIVEDPEDAETRGEALLEDAVSYAEDRGFDVKKDLLYGDPVETIPDYAGGNGFDALFVGHRGVSERMESIVGSVAKTLVERSPVPVTVVR